MYKLKAKAEAIGRKRIEKGMTMADLSRESGVSRLTLTNIERGMSGNPRPAIAHKIVQALNAEFEELFEIEG